MKNAVLSWIKENNMVNPGDTVICAVSGGVDSVVLLSILSELRDELEIKVCAAHFNHHIRGEESDRDAEFTRMLCESRFNVEYFEGNGDVLGRVKQTGESVEEAARYLRYQFLENIIPGAKIATAHHANDNLETMIMNMIRGCGTQGICGIPPIRGNIIRPLLCMTRDQIVGYAAENGIDHVEDSTNSCDDYLRNRIRHNFIPMMVKENRSTILNCFKAANAIREDNEYLNKLASEKYNQLIRVDGMLCTDDFSYEDEAAPILKRLAMLVLKENGVCYSNKTVEDFLNCVNSKSHKCTANLPGGVSVIKQGEFIRFTDTKMAEPVEETEFEVGDFIKFGDWESEITSTYMNKVSRIPTKGMSRDVLVLNANSIHGKLRVRSKKAGDRIKMPGGTKQLVRVMRDFGYNEEDRNKLPVFCDDNGIVAVGGVGIDMNHKVELGDSAIVIVLNLNN